MNKNQKKSRNEVSYLIGIDQIAAYVPSYYLSLESLALSRNLEKNRYQKDLGQEAMAVCPPNEDIITMAINACLALDIKNDERPVSWILFCTESSVDQSKAAAIYIQHFLNLPSNTRCLELKQACFSATAALELAKSLVKNAPNTRVLIIASDVARYGFHTSGEPTQGCGAIAFTVTSNPKILVVNDEVGVFCDHVMDFWRPNYLDFALVSSSYSVKNYLNVLEVCWNQFCEKFKNNDPKIDYFCYHTPFSKMALRVHERFFGNVGKKSFDIIGYNEINDAVKFNKIIGNIYTGSLYLSLMSLLKYCSKNLKEKRIGLFSYGSGCVAQYFCVTVQPNYKDFLLMDSFENSLGYREKLAYEQYQYFYHFPTKMSDLLKKESNPIINSSYNRKKGNIYLSAIKNHERIYEFFS
jgi:hydroxymethylglutaryl-CoA synthase